MTSTLSLSPSASLSHSCSLLSDLFVQPLPLLLSPSTFSRCQLLRKFSSCGAWYFALTVQISHFSVQCSSIVQHSLLGDVPSSFLRHETSHHQLFSKPLAFLPGDLSFFLMTSFQFSRVCFSGLHRFHSISVNSSHHVVLSKTRFATISKLVVRALSQLLWSCTFPLCLYFPPFDISHLFCSRILPFLWVLFTHSLSMFVLICATFLPLSVLVIETNDT